MEPSFQLSIIKYIDRFVSNVSDFIVKDVLNTAHPTYEFTVYFIYQIFSARSFGSNQMESSGPFGTRRGRSSNGV